MWEIENKNSDSYYKNFFSINLVQLVMWILEENQIFTRIGLSKMLYAFAFKVSLPKGVIYPFLAVALRISSGRFS